MIPIANAPPGCQSSFQLGSDAWVDADGMYVGGSGGSGDDGDGWAEAGPHQQSCRARFEYLLNNSALGQILDVFQAHMLCLCVICVCVFLCVCSGWVLVCVFVCLGVFFCALCACGFRLCRLCTFCAGALSPS